MASNFGFLIGWGEVKVGRDHKAGQVFQEAYTYFQRQAQDGAIDSVEVVRLMGHAGDLKGFFVLRGERERVRSLIATEEFNRVIVRGQAVVHNLGISEIRLDQEAVEAMRQAFEQTADLVT